MNRIDQKFIELRKNKKKAFIAFITAGDPDLKTTEKLVLAFEKAGVDIVELGVPFSDPLADGPTIQASSQRALSRGVNLDKILRTVQMIRRQSEIPVALMTYYNPVFHMGEKSFVQKASQCGVDGIIIPDLPPDEAKDLIALARKKNLATVFFVAPTTTPERIRTIAQVSTGFVYYISLTGVTGAKQNLASLMKRQVKLIKQSTSKPVCVGFGVSTPGQVATISKIADGVIVGSAIVNQIAASRKKAQIVRNTAGFVKQLTRAIS